LTAAKIHEISQEDQQEKLLWKQPTEVSVFRFQVSAQPLAAEEANLIE